MKIELKLADGFALSTQMYIFIILFCQNNKAFPLGSWMLRSTGGSEHIVLSSHACQVERHTGKGTHVLFHTSLHQWKLTDTITHASLFNSDQRKAIWGAKGTEKSTWSVIHSVPKSLLILPSALPRMHQAWCSCWRNSNKKTWQRSLPLWNCILVGGNRQWL